MNYQLVNDLINSAKNYQNDRDIILIEKAINFAKKAHQEHKTLTREKWEAERNEPISNMSMKLHK